MKVLSAECSAQETLSAKRWRCDCRGAWKPVEPAGIKLRGLPVAKETRATRTAGFG